MRYSIYGHCPKTDSDNYFIAPSAELIGDVRLGDQASVWFQTVIRADMDKIVIGNRSNVQDACMLHVDKGFPLHLGEGVTVGHKVLLHGCTIGDNSLIGMNATIMNGVTIGKNCIIGAGALLTEHSQIPDNSLVLGVPAKVVKPVTEAQITMIRESAAHYVDNALSYRHELNKLDML